MNNITTKYIKDFETCVYNQYVKVMVYEYIKDDCTSNFTVKFEYKNTNYRIVIYNDYIVLFKRKNMINVIENIMKYLSHILLHHNECNVLQYSLIKKDLLFKKPYTKDLTDELTREIVYNFIIDEKFGQEKTFMESYNRVFRKFELIINGYY